MCLADAEDGQLRVAQRLGLVVALARENVGHMRRAEALAGRLYRLDHPQRFRRAVDEVNGIEADIAIAAGQ